MEHLTNAEILGYVKTERIDEESVALDAKVTKHISHCGECLEKLKGVMASLEALEAIVGTEDAGVNSFVFDISREAVMAEVQIYKNENREAQPTLNK